MIRLAASDHYPAEVYLPVLLIFIRSSTILHLVHRMFTSDMRKRTPSSGRVQELSQSEGGRGREYRRSGPNPAHSVTKPSATSRARSSAASPIRSSSSGALSAGTM